MKDANNEPLMVGDSVWIETRHVSGRGVVEILFKKTCYVRCGADLEKIDRKRQIEKLRR